MKTASFFTYSGPGRVSIARAPPRNTPRGFKVYSSLAPGPWFRTPDRDEYEALYRAQLDQLDPQKVWDELHVLGAGSEPILLCWEKPPFNDRNFCHRRQVAAYFEHHLGHRVDEIT